MADLVGVSELARQLKKSKGTISKHAEAGKIPVADRDKNGAPLFDVDQVRQAYEPNINPLMRRQGEPVAPPAKQPDLDIAVDQPVGADDQVDDDQDDTAGERRSVGSGGGDKTLLQEQVTERQLRNRRLTRQIGEDEGRLVLRSIVEEEQTTMARQTRDAVTAYLGDKASAAYAFAAQPRTESEWRVWLSERSREAFNHFESTLALQDDDEFDEDEQSVDGDTGPTDAAPVA